MTRSLIALFCASESGTLNFRDLVLKRFLQAALVGIVAVASVLIGTIISSIIFTGIEL